VIEFSEPALSQLTPAKLCQMSAMGHEQTSRHVGVMSVIHLKADIHERGLHVRFVPQTDLATLDGHQPFASPTRGCSACRME
jgi:hypothetical protein